MESTIMKLQASTNLVRLPSREILKQKNLLRPMLEKETYALTWVKRLFNIEG